MGSYASSVKVTVGVTLSGGGGSGPAVGDGILLEDESFLLLENEGFILLE